MDDPLYVGQADAGAAELVSVEPLEDAEQFVLVRHVEAHSVVADEDDDLAVYRRLRSHFDVR